MDAPADRLSARSPQKRRHPLASPEVDLPARESPDPASVDSEVDFAAPLA
jgi:hypothetical protein